VVKINRNLISSPVTRRQRKPRTELERLLAGGNTAQKIAKREISWTGKVKPMLAPILASDVENLLVERGLTVSRGPKALISLAYNYF
jgi:hypothetical protein